MDVIVAYCGLICDGCPIYWATREKEVERKDKMRAAIARMCKEHYGTELTPEDITDCDGCRTEGGRLYSGCRNCKIRECARQKGLENCAYCRDYICDSLKKFFETDPSAKTRLDFIRSIL